MTNTVLCVFLQAITSVNNLLSGPMFVSHRGSLRVTQQSSGRVAVIKFKEPGMTSLSTKGRKTANRPVCPFSYK